MTDVSALPEQLKEDGRFCVWKYEERDGKQTKMPYNPRTGGKAQSNNPASFSSVDIAAAAQSRYSGMGIGVFGDICAIDIDRCVNDQGQLSELAADVTAIMNTYTEISPGKKGIRSIFKARGFDYDKAKYFINNQKLGLEVYVAGATHKYLTVTGNSLTPGKDIEERGAELQIVLDRYMLRMPKQPPKKPPPQTFELFSENDTDQQLIAKAERAKNGAVFSRLYSGDISDYESHSEADQALCNHLAYWTGRDPERIDRIFRMSGLMRDKWDRQQSGSTYGRITIDKAIRDCRGTYNPQEFFKQQMYKEEFQQPDLTGERGGMKRILADLHPEKNDRYGWHDIGNGNLFADWFKDIARYVPERKKWYVYDGKVWKPDTGGLKVMQLCKALADNLMVYALTLDDEQQKQKYMKSVARWQRRNYRETIIKDAQGVHPISAAEFDKDPYTFNCLNGTLNLQTGSFHSHNPEDLLSKVSGVNYDPGAKSERWERFIDEVMQGDKPTAEFLQKALGYALAGHNRFECFFILYGPTTRNGKGTCMETHSVLMGDYGKTANPETIAQKHNSDSRGPSSDVARLAGARFVNIAEPDKKLILSAAFVKRLTGRDTITARELYESEIEFPAQFKIFINTNYLPTVTDSTVFDSGRVKIIPFERHFKDEEQDQGLKDELTQPDNLSGILNWCLEGLRMIEEMGFDPPESVRDATEDYRRSSDKITRFLEDEFDEDSLAETKTSDAYTRYKVWCQANGFFPENSTNFKTLISKSVSVVRKRPKVGGGMTTLIRGYRLTTDFIGFEGYG